MLVAMLVPVSFLSAPAAYAAITTEAAASTLLFNPRIKASSATTSVLGLNLVTNAADTLNQVRFTLNGAASFALADLEALSAAGTSGLALYKDNKAAGMTGSLDLAQDTRVALSAAPTAVQVTQVSKLAATATALVTDTALTLTAGDIVFVNTSANPTALSYGWHLVTTGNAGSGGVAASALRLDAAGAAPTFVSGSRLAKFTPAATTTANASTAGGTLTVSAGDLVFGRRATESTYTWHIVTAGTTLADDSTENNAALNGEVDDGAITANTSVAKLVPAGTATDNGVTAEGTLAVAVGDVVFVKIGSYGWHIVTTAGNLSSNAAENTAFLDGGSADPAIVANSQMSKLSTSGGTFQLTTAAISDTSLVIAAGNVAFSQLTEHPHTTLGVAWGMFTTGGTGVSSTALRVNDDPAAPLFGWVVTLTPAAGQAIPANDTGANAGADYFITVKTASGATNSRTLRLGIGEGDLTFDSGTPTSAPIAVLTDAITIDSTAPTVSNTGPANNSTNVPVSTFVSVNFSEDIDPTTITPGNVTLTTGGAPVGIGFRTYPSGFNVIVSNPPTFTAASRFARVANTTAGYFQIGSTGSSIFPGGGTYTAPAAGDIVYFQQDTFPAELGIVTNATMTSGTFAINGFAPMGGKSITKFAPATATGLVTAATNVGIGDLVVVSTSANPTTDRYQWHIASTTAPVNNAALRLDDAAAAPTYAGSSSFSLLRPTATSTVAVAGTLTQGLNFVLGDLIFAKVSANADNTGTFAWHVVTTAENVSAGNAAATLRLDSGSAAPTFAGNTVVAKLTGGTTGLSDNSDSANTNFATGDLIFAETTANASNNGAYNFHLVSAQGTGANSTALRLDNSSTNLTTGATYILTVGTGVTDSGGNPLASAQTVTFATGSTGGTNTTPPSVISSTPFDGNQSHPTTAPIKLQFSQDMASSGGGSVTTVANVGLFLESNGAVGAAVSATNGYDSATKTVTITPAAALTASSGYIVKVATSTLSASGAPAMARSIFFRTSSGTDTTKPKVQGVFPANAATAVERNLNAISLGFSEDMNPASITSSSVTLSGGISGAISYDTKTRTAFFSPTQSLAASTEYTVTVTSSATDLSGNVLDQDAVTAGNQTFTSTFTTASAADSAAPSVQYANADNFSVSVTFSEAMKSGAGPNAVDNIANFSLESPVGSSISLGGKTVTYDAPNMTAKIAGLSLQHGNTFKVTVAATAHDLASNALSTSGSPAGNIAQGSVMDASVTGGQIGPGGGPQQSASLQGMNPVRVMPMSRQAGAKSNYTVEFLASSTIPVGGSIVLTFPVGFDVTNAAAMSATETLRNADINGPKTGTTTITSVTGNASSRTVTLVTGGDATGTNAFISFELKNIVNTSVPSDAGYTVDIKTKNDSGVLLESKTSAAFFLGATGSNTLTVTVFQDDGAGTPANAGNKTKDSGETGIASATLFLFSPANGGLSTTTRSTGAGVFENLASGDYMLMLDPGSISFQVNSVPQPVSITGNTAISYGLGSSGASLTIAGTITGPASTKLDVFASSFNGFSKTTVTTSSGGTVAYSLPVQANTTYRVGVGPAMPNFIPGSTPPKPPTFTFMPPPEVEVKVAAANVTGKNFTLTTAGKRITGSVLDSNGSAVSNAGIFARPSQDSNVGGGSSTGFGVGGETGTDGSFSLNVVPGVYVVGVFKPGMPNVPEKQITVPSSGANTPSSLAFKLDAGTSVTISGTVKDDNGNAIPYAGVGGRKVTSTTDTSAVGGGANNFVGSPTAADGTYTLYVDTGTWVIEAFAPEVGFLGSKTVTVTASLTGQDFSAATLALGAVTGRVTKASVAQQGVIVRAEGVNGKNMAVTDGSGDYKLKVPAGTYSVYSNFPGVGEGTPLTGVVVTANTTTSGKNIALAAPITLTINVTDGTNAITNAFVEVRDSNGRGNGTSESSTSGANAVYSLNLAPGTYTVRVNHPAYGPIGTTASVDTTRTITYTATAGALKTVTGTIQSGGSALSGAWVQLIGKPTGQTIPVVVGATTNSSGVYTMSVPVGEYSLRADKALYVAPAETTLTVTANVTAATLSLAASSRTISGTVSLSGSAVSGAFVNATNGAGGFAAGQTDSDGLYSLAVTDGTWTVFARSLGSESSDASVTVSGANATQNITLAAITGYVPKQKRQESVIPGSGGFLTNSDIGSLFRMNMPPNALGIDTTAATVNTQPTTAVPKPPKGAVLAKNAITISAVDSGGQPITALSPCVTITVPYTEADLPAGASENDLVIGAWNDATQNYDTWPTTIDATNDTLSACVTHFSDFAPLLPSVTAPTTTTTTTTTTGSGGIVGGSVSTRAPSVLAPASTTTATPIPVDVAKPSTLPTPSATPVASPAPTAIVRAAVTFTQPLTSGSRSGQVRELQRMLNADPDTQITASGAGSPGNETTLLGPLTVRAIQKFQVKYGLARQGEAGYGFVGPKTRAKLNELASRDETPASVAAPRAAPGTTLSVAARTEVLSQIIILLQKIAELQAELRKVQVEGSTL